MKTVCDMTLLHVITLRARIAALAATLLAALITAPQLLASGDDDPLLTMVMVDRLEWRSADSTWNGEDPLIWEVDAWLGHDLNKLWLKTEGEWVSGDSEEVELQMLYSRAVTPFWNAQIGWRSDWKPEPERHWVTVGLRGLAPGFIDTNVALFFGNEGRTALRLEAEYELLLTQKLVLSPEIEINFYGENDVASGAGAGLADIEAGVRLYYFLRREFAPYVGFNWQRRYGNTADYARVAGQDTDNSELVVGLRMWF